MTPLLGRIAREKKTVLVPLGAAVLINVLAYVIVVRPLGLKAAGTTDRAAAAANAVAAAEKDLALARALVTGKSQADEELSAFYEKVLPTDLTAARRLTYASLPALARKTGVRYEARTTSIDDTDKESRLGHMTIRMVLQGDYESLREYIYELESSPAFVIIDDVTLAESSSNEPLTLTINLSTYYRLRPNAT